MATCEMCHRPLRPAGRGRPPRYCSHACRSRAYRARGASRAADAPTSPAPVETPAETSAATAEAPGLRLDRIVGAAIAVADRDGVERLSMRATAAELDAGVMSLYRHVANREDLIDHMVDTVFGGFPLPEPGPDGWRARLELSARHEWDIYTRHPWVAPLVAVTTRPPIAPNLMAYTDWRMRAVDGYGLDFTSMLRIAIMVSTYLQGAALTRAREIRALRDTRLTRQEWLATRHEAIQAALAARELPMVARFRDESYRASEPDAVFEFGLDRVLDGIAVLLDRVGNPERP